MTDKSEGALEGGVLAIEGDGGELEITMYSWGASELS